MASYTFSKKAVDDLSAIWEYSCEVWSEQQADKYYWFLNDVCQLLAEDKLTGKLYELPTEGVLGYRADKHIVFYFRVESGRILVLRILHTRMDYRKEF